MLVVLDDVFDLDDDLVGSPVGERSRGLQVGLLSLALRLVTPLHQGLQVIHFHTSALKSAKRLRSEVAVVFVALKSQRSFHGLGNVLHQSLHEVRNWLFFEVSFEDAHWLSLSFVK